MTVQKINTEKQKRQEQIEEILKWPKLCVMAMSEDNTFTYLIKGATTAEVLMMHEILKLHELLGLED